MGSIGCYADEDENRRVAMKMGVKIAALLAHLLVYFSNCITIITSHV